MKRCDPNKMRGHCRYTVKLGERYDCKDAHEKLTCRYKCYAGNIKTLQNRNFTLCHEKGTMQKKYSVSIILLHLIKNSINLK